MNNKYLNKIAVVQTFAVNPVEILEDQFDPQTEDYIERRKLLKIAKSQIQQSSKDIEIVFNSIASLNSFKSDIAFAHKTAFNTQCIKDLSMNYGRIAAIFKDLERADKKLQKVDAYSDVYVVLSNELDCNMFDIFIEDLDEILSLAIERNKTFNEKVDKQYIKDLEVDKKTYIESFKFGLKN